jgi:hypothetical protein
VKIWQLGDDDEDMRYLDRMRLLGQWREWHMIWATIGLHNRNWQGWEKPQHRAHLYHVRELVRLEMLARGYKPKKELTLPPVNTAVEQQWLVASAETIAQERWSLVCRCKGVYGGSGRAPLWWQVLLHQYTVQGGCRHEQESHEVIHRHPRILLCLACKQALSFDNGGSWVPRQKGQLRQIDNMPKGGRSSMSIRLDTATPSIIIQIGAESHG